jgi:hypothetical protein
VKTGTLVDATIIASARETDEGGRWVKHKNRAAVYGFKAHVGRGCEQALVEQVAVTPATLDRMLCLMILARCLPTAPIAARLFAKAASSDQPPPGPEVLSFVREWRPVRDSNPCYQRELQKMSRINALTVKPRALGRYSA